MRLEPTSTSQQLPYVSVLLCELLDKYEYVRQSSKFGIRSLTDKAIPPAIVTILAWNDNERVNLAFL